MVLDKNDYLQTREAMVRSQEELQLVGLSRYENTMVLISTGSWVKEVMVRSVVLTPWPVSYHEGRLLSTGPNVVGMI